MRKDDLDRPLPHFVSSHARVATVEVILTVEPEIRMQHGDLEEVLDEVARRVDGALRGCFDTLPADVRIDDVSVVNPPHVPFFPATLGGEVYRDQTEVYEAVGKLREGTPLDGLLYDSAGRAFEVVVWTSFRRAKGEDRRLPALWTGDGEG